MNFKGLTSDEICKYTWNWKFIKKNMSKITLTEEKELIIQNVRTSHITLLLDVRNVIAIAARFKL